MTVSYGLIRGREWVCAPSRHPRGMARPSGPLIDRCTGELVWTPGLTLGPREGAWVTSSLPLALARAAVLRILPQGFAVAVQAFPRPEGEEPPARSLWEVWT
jgi:hypothetical protein